MDAHTTAYDSSALLTPQGVQDYLRAYGVEEVYIKALNMHRIDGLALCLLSEKDLHEIVDCVGQRKRVLFASAEYRKSVIGKLENCHPAIENGSFSVNCGNRSEVTDLLEFIDKRRDRTTPHDSSECCLSSQRQPVKYVVETNSKPWKVFVSAFYLFIVAGITSFVMVIAHERLPNISKYPPLPDLFLDNLPYINWAFEAAEWVGVILGIVWTLILVFHRYRCILLRRFFAILGTVFLLRSVTMIITSLSVPGEHLAKQCTPYAFTNNTARFNRFLEIWLGMGMSIRGIQTCGDYMFSGHTTVLTLLNFFITEYTPWNLQVIHTFSWVLNLFGVFFILVSHEHYSIDVFIAIYVSSRLFLYYHCLANSRILHQEDKKRAMIWFPLFTFFEYDVCGIVPNEYEIPLLALWTSFSAQACQQNPLSSAHHGTDGDAKKVEVILEHLKAQ